MLANPTSIARWMIIAGGLGLLVISTLASWLLRDQIFQTFQDPGEPFQTYTPPAPADYATTDAWFAQGNFSNPDEAAVFFVHPTTYTGGANWNGELDKESAVREVVDIALPNYAAPFARSGELFAPRYRQAALYAFMNNREDSVLARELAQTDIQRAFTQFLRETDPEQPFFIVGVGHDAIVGKVHPLDLRALYHLCSTRFRLFEQTKIEAFALDLIRISATAVGFGEDVARVLTVAGGEEDRPNAMQEAEASARLGILLMMFSVTMLTPVPVALLSHEPVHRFVDAFAVTIITGLLIWLPVRRQRADLRLRDGFLIVCSFWVGLGMFGCVPFLVGDSFGLSWTDAVFESMSGLTTTGSTVLSGLDAMPRGLLYYRQQLQWLGGMGIVVLAVAILPMLGVGGMQLYRAEMPGPVKDNKLTPRITETAKTLWYIYVSLTGLCALGYYAGATH